MLLGITALFGTQQISLAGPAQSRPNIVFVLIDDMGWADLSCFGNKQAKTPNIDRLASEGIVFEQFCVNSPICSPSRVAISTGQYPQRWKITSYLDNAQKNAQRGLANWLDPKAPMLASSLKASGYATGHFGKWHMGGQRDVTNAPPITDYGFDKSLTSFEGTGPKLLPLTMEPGWGKPRKIWADAEHLEGPFEWRMRCTITTGYADAALEFIKNAETQKQPFFVNLWPDDVHGPWFPSVKNWKNSTPDLYLAVLEELDQQLGHFFDYIRNDDNLRDNTLIVFCSDNGADPKTFDHDTKPFRGSKATLYEGGLRSPLIVWGPKFLNKKAVGTRNSTSVFSAIDLAPSLLKLAGAQPPQNTELDGEDMLDTLLGESDRSRTAPIFFSRPPDFKTNFGGEKILPDLAVRQGHWKLLCDYDGTRPELYDVFADPGEKNNLMNAQPEIAGGLIKEVSSWYRSVSQ